MDNIDSRTMLLLGDSFNKISQYKVAIIGVGGVGSIIPLTLARTGFKELIVVDKDQIDITNLNRQIAYELEDVGRIKVDVIKQKVLKIRTDINVDTYCANIDDKFDFNIFKTCDFIIDCIDDINAKVEIAKYALDNDIKYITSMGMGNRIDPTKIVMTKLNKTTDDPLAKKFRYLLKKEGIDISKIDVAFSNEKPLKKDKIISSISFVPNACGLIISSFIVKTIIGGVNNEIIKNWKSCF